MRVIKGVVGERSVTEEIRGRREERGGERRVRVGGESREEGPANGGTSFAGKKK